MTSGSFNYEGLDANMQARHENRTLTMLLRTGEKNFEELLNINMEKEMEQIILPEQYLKNTAENQDTSVLIDRAVTDDITCLGQSFNLTQEQVIQMPFRLYEIVSILKAALIDLEKI